MTRKLDSPSILGMSTDSAASEGENRSGWLDWIERIGNRLPHPVTLSIVGCILVLIFSQVANMTEWSARKTVMKTDSEGEIVQALEVVTATGLLASNGAFWYSECSPGWTWAPYGSASHESVHQFSSRTHPNSARPDILHTF